MTNANNQSNPSEEHTLVQFPTGQATASTGTQSSATKAQDATYTGPLSVPVKPKVEEPDTIGTTGINKEGGPQVTVPVLAEVMRATEEAPVIELAPDVAEVGVEAINPNPQLTQQHKNIGITEAKESTPMQQVVKDNTKLPFSVEKAQEIVKGQLISKDPSNPMLWLAWLIIKQTQIKEKKESEKNQ